MKIIAVLITAILFSVMLGFSKTRSAAPSNGPVIKTLFQKAIADEFTPGRQVIVDYVEVAPNTTMDRHWHPGEEFHYYLDGEVELAIDGSPSIKGTPGAVAHVPFKKMHTVITREKGVKIIVFRVNMLGEPVRYLEKESPAAK